MRPAPRKNGPTAIGPYVVKRSQFQPAYLRLYESGELARRVELALEKLRDCVLCPRECRVNRLDNKFAVCRTGRHAVVSSCFAHFGEEDCLRGPEASGRGSGTIFFGFCNLRCVFCQNYETSWLGEGFPAPPEKIAALMLELQARGCHNINFVTPEHVVPQILEALLLAVEGGLRLPLVYNTGAYDSLDSLALLDGVVDIYMPDFKFWEPEMARLYARAPDYPETARRAIREMHRQVGLLVFDEDGLALRGVLLRHLLMPGGVAGTQQIAEWLARELGPDTYVNLMTQYRPAGKVTAESFPIINRAITPAEFEHALATARAAGLRRFDQRSL
ncbi:MAG: radical SAM protein [Acidobacteria bacterium]|nr:radical SAM protein [Acidobacteriota bacterium]MBI3663119.1 radical SAM protein [Acidobacteriota bacterium]